MPRTATLSAIALCSIFFGGCSGTTEGHPVEELTEDGLKKPPQTPAGGTGTGAIVTGGGQSLGPSLLPTAPTLPTPTGANPQTPTPGGPTIPAPAVDSGPISAPGGTLPRGELVWRSIVVNPVGGKGPILRRYGVYLPKSASATTPLPLVTMAHGYAMSAQGMYDVTPYGAKAEKEGFVVAFMDAQVNGPLNRETFAGPGPWNVGKDVHGPGHDIEADTDDFGFLRELRKDVESYQKVDPDHVFQTGFSMGGYFTNHVGCVLGRAAVRAIAPHSGGTFRFNNLCATGHMPVILFHGTSDIVIGPRWGLEARDEWVAKNGCSTTVDVVPVKGGRCEVHRGCPADGQVQMCIFDHMNHGWAGGNVAPATFPEIYHALHGMDPTLAGIVRGIEEGILSYDTAIKHLLKFLADNPLLGAAPSFIPHWNYVWSAPSYASATDLTWDFWKKYAW
jgi:poly(3-hydroxybutyrate) depolymerase